GFQRRGCHSAVRGSGRQSRKPPDAVPANLRRCEGGEQRSADAVERRSDVAAVHRHLQSLDARPSRRSIQPATFTGNRYRGSFAPPAARYLGSGYPGLSRRVPAALSEEHTKKTVRRTFIVVAEAGEEAHDHAFF